MPYARVVRETEQPFGNATVSFCEHEAIREKARRNTLTECSVGLCARAVELDALCKGRGARTTVS